MEAEKLYGVGPQGRLLEEVHGFVAQELDVSIFRNRQNFVDIWQPDKNIFSGRACLKDLGITPQTEELRILSVTVVADDGESILPLDPVRAREESSHDVDGYVDYFASKFLRDIKYHSHNLCLAALAQRNRIAQERGRRLYNLRAAKSGDILTV